MKVLREFESHSFRQAFISFFKANSILKLPHYFLLSIAMALLGCQSTGQDGKPLTPAEIIEKRAATIKMGESGLTAFYKQNPAARKEIEAAAGYAVVSDQCQCGFIGGGTWRGHLA